MVRELVYRWEEVSGRLEQRGRDAERGEIAPGATDQTRQKELHDWSPLSSSQRKYSTRCSSVVVSS